MDEKVPDEEVKMDHEWCLLCGSRNPRSLHLHFMDEGGRVSAEFTPGSELQGYQGIIHGGIITSLLDSAMTHCLFKRGIKALTGDLHVRFYRSVAVGKKVRIAAWLDSSRPPLYSLKSELFQQGAIAARAEAKFMKQEDLP